MSKSASAAAACSSGHFSTAIASLLLDMKKSWRIEPTPDLRLIKRYFRELAFGRITRDKVGKAVRELLEKDSGHETRVTVHLTLFLHSNYPEVEEMVIEEDLYQIVPAYLEPVAISEDDYNWLVSELGLDPDFMYQHAEAPIIPLPQVESSDTGDQLLKRLMASDFSVLTSIDFKEHRDEIVRQAFRDGVHDGYENHGQGLTYILGSLRMRMRSISTMTETVRQKFMDEIYTWAFQNPVLAITVLITNSVRIKDCFLLHQLRVFLDLPIGEANSNAQMPSETPLLEFALYKAILELDETSPVWHFFFTGLSILVDQKFIEFPKLVQILKILIKEFSTSSTVENLANLLKLFRCVLTPAIEQNRISAEELLHLRTFISIITGATYMADESPAVMSPRRTCLLLRNLIDEKLSDHPEIDESGIPTNDGSTLQLGLIYIRIPNHRATVEKLISDEAEDPKWSSIEAIEELTDHSINLIAACCRLELEGVAKFLRILVQNRPILQALGLHQFMNRILSAGFQARNVRTSKLLGFFSSYMEFIKGVEGEEFAVAYEDHLEIIKTLVSLMFGIYKSSDKVRAVHAMLSKKARVSGRIFDILYELIEWGHGRHIVYPEKIKEEILKTVKLVPDIVQPSSAHTGCGVRYKKVLEYLKDL